MKASSFALFRNRVSPATLFAPFIIVPLLATGASAQGQYNLDGGTDTLSSAAFYDGESVGDTFIPQAPYFESTGQRDAFLVRGGATLTLASGADISVINDDNHTAFGRIGYGTDGTLVIEDGATLRVGQDSRYANFHVGHDATGLVTQTGGSATFIGSVNVGANGGTGTYTISGGTFTFDQTTGGGTSLLSVGFNNAAASSGNSTGTFNINGGEVNILSSHGGSTQFILGNRVNTALGTSDPSGTGSGTLNQTAGTFTIGAGANLFLSGYGDGTYNLSGGTLRIGGQSLRARYGSGATGTYDFNFSGGSIEVTGSDLVSDVDIDITTGTGSIINTNGLNATLSGVLSGPGTLVKAGAGNLNVSGDNELTGSFYVTGGTVNQTAGTSAVRYFAVGSGSGSTGDFNITGGSLDISSSLQIGDFGGTSEFTIDGGDVFVGSAGGASMNIGNQGGTGTLNLESGSLTLGNGLHSLGRMDNRPTGTPAGSGTINVSGGLLEIVDNGSLILGDRILSNTNTSLPAKDAWGSGILNQDGGTVRVSNGTLFVAGFDASASGTYNLNAGTLEIGGNSLRARYNNSVSQSNFNLGGGLLKVINSQLQTDVHFNLVTSTTSTVDTGTFGASVSGFNGTGNLNKTGLSNLAISSNSSIGNLSVNQGSMSSTAQVSVNDLHLGAGTSFTGGGSLTVGGTFTGSGSLGIATRVDGTLAVGNSPGILSVSTDLTIGSGAVFEMDLTGNSTGLAGLTFDQIDLTLGKFEMEDGAIFSIAFDSVDFNNAFWGETQSWLVVDGDGSGEVVIGNISITGSEDFSSYGSFSLNGTGDDLALNWTPVSVPEPSIAALAALMTPILLKRRRRSC